MQWSIDSADAFSVARVRHAVVDELRSILGRDADVFAAETVLGELLGAEMDRGHLALAVTVERGIGGPSIHIYTQGKPGATTTRGELREAILRETRIPMSIEITGQGSHICLRVPMSHEELPNPELWKTASDAVQRRASDISKRLQR